MDCDEKELFRGIINRPVMSPAQEIVIEHTDKCEKILERFRELASEKKFTECVTKLAADFEKHGATDINIKRFHILDRKITECILSAAMDTKGHEPSQAEALSFISGRQYCQPRFVIPSEGSDR